MAFDAMTFTPDTPTSLESRGNPYEMLQLCGSLESVTPTDLAAAFSCTFPPLEVFLAEGLKPKVWEWQANVLAQQNQVGTTQEDPTVITTADVWVV